MPIRIASGERESEGPIEALCSNNRSRKGSGSGRVSPVSSIVVWPEERQPSFCSLRIVVSVFTDAMRFARAEAGCTARTEQLCSHPLFVFKQAGQPG